MCTYQSAVIWYGHMHVACKSQLQCTVTKGGLQVKVAVALQAVSVLCKSACCGSSRHLLYSVWLASRNRSCSCSRCLVLLICRQLISCRSDSMRHQAWIHPVNAVLHTVPTFNLQVTAAPLGRIFASMTNLIGCSYLCRETSFSIYIKLISQLSTYQSMSPVFRT